MLSTDSEVTVYRRPVYSRNFIGLFSTLERLSGTSVPKSYISIPCHDGNYATIC